VVLVAFVVALFLPELPLSTQSGLERMAAEAAAARAAAPDGEQLVVDPGRSGAPGPAAVVTADGRRGKPSDMKTTWKPHTAPGQLSSEDRKELPDSVYAFPKQRKEPLTDAAHVRTALARFDQVQGVSDDERDQAFANIQKAADHYDVDVAESDWRQLGRRPHTKNPAH
jgi:hypothetical protein